MDAHTPGPWRFEVNIACKQILLVGARGWTVMDFSRWGMVGAAPRFLRRDPGIMERADALTVVAPGREHHAHWFRHIKHPDAQLIEAAPALLELARQYASECGECAGAGITPDDQDCEQCRDIRDVIAKATGDARPG